MEKATIGDVNRIVFESEQMLANQIKSLLRSLEDLKPLKDKFDSVKPVI